MLVLTRKKNQGLTISHPAGDVRVVVVEIRGDREHVRLGFEADKSITIVRDDARVKIHTVSAALADGTLSDCGEATDLADNQTSTIPAASLHPEYQGCGRAYTRLEDAVAKEFHP